MGDDIEGYAPSDAASHAVAHLPTVLRVCAVQPFVIPCRR
jgi:hypothetical protein